MRTLLCILVLLPTLALAAPQGVMVRLSSGTGFVINNEGHVITNHHVVKECQSISILTAAGQEAAELVAYDDTHDLAVLKTNYHSPYTAPLRWNIEDLKVSDPVVVLGFPGELGAGGRYVFKKSEVTGLKGPKGEEALIQLKNVAAQGNSGGPVLDNNGNVIAVIAGVVTTYKADASGNPVGPALEQSDVAITLAALEDFLHANKVNFYQSGTNKISYSDGILRDNARNFIVPVRCIQDVIR